MALFKGYDDINVMFPSSNTYKSILKLARLRRHFLYIGL
jgi:hypothetical protein